MEKNFWLDSNELSSSLPTELGKLSLMEYNFMVGWNKLTSSLPTELGQIRQMYLAPPTQLVYGQDFFFMFKVEGNSELCGSIPTQLQSLSSSSWDESTSSRFFMANRTSIGEVRG